ncbi:MAG: TrkA family potassium uptake protein [Ruminiclostridium sp.]|nr:TrkA family potassium uptake protein [Ruminiclostridium sp.]
MNIIIVGCGRVGSRLAIQLSGEGNNVTVIDRNPLSFDKLEGASDVKMVIGTGIDEEVLSNAGIASADAVISVTKGDNTNIMVGQIAKFLFKVPKVVVRIVDPKSKSFYEQEIGLTCFCPTETSSHHYISLLKGVDVCTLL